MPWFKVDDNLAFHAKTIAAGNAAMGMWVRAGSWCASTLTDGFVPNHMVTSFGSKSLAKKLVQAGFWLEAEGGYQFHEWGERQPTKEHVEKDRTAARERMRAARDEKRSKNVRANTDRTSGEVRSTRPDPSHTDTYSPKEASHVSDARASDPQRDERPSGKPVDVDGWRLVRAVIPSEHPQASRTMLAMRAGELLKGGTPDTDVRAALELWLTKPNLGPATLPSLVSEVIRNRNQPATGAIPGTALAPTGTTGSAGSRKGIGKPTSKALGYMNAAQELANAMMNEGTTR